MGIDWPAAGRHSLDFFFTVARLDAASLDIDNAALVLRLLYFGHIIFRWMNPLNGADRD